MIIPHIALIQVVKNMGCQVKKTKVSSWKLVFTGSSKCSLFFYIKKNHIYQHGGYKKYDHCICKLIVTDWALQKRKTKEAHFWPLLLAVFCLLMDAGLKLNQPDI